MQNTKILSVMNELIAKPDWTVEDFANYTGYKKSTIYSFIYKNAIPFSKPQGKVFFKRDDCLAFIRGGKVKSEKEIQREASRLALS